MISHYFRTDKEKNAAKLRSKKRERIIQQRKQFVKRKAERDAVRNRGVVYFVTDGTGFVKIGCTCCDVSIRLSALQTSNPRKLSLIGTIQTDNIADLELQIHSEFEPQRNAIGEWFAITFDDVIECLARHGGTLNLER